MGWCQSEVSHHHAQAVGVAPVRNERLIKEGPEVGRYGLLPVNELTGEDLELLHFGGVELELNDDGDALVVGEFGGVCDVCVQDHGSFKVLMIRAALERESTSEKSYGTNFTISVLTPVNVNVIVGIFLFAVGVRCRVTHLILSPSFDSLSFERLE